MNDKVFPDEVDFKTALLAELVQKDRFLKTSLKAVYGLNDQGERLFRCLYFLYNQLKFRSLVFD